MNVGFKISHFGFKNKKLNFGLTFKVKEKIWSLLKVCARQNFKKIPHDKVPVETRRKKNIKAAMEQKAVKLNHRNNMTVSTSFTAFNF